MDSLGSLAHVVLTNGFLLRIIVSFQRGLPHDLVRLAQSREVVPNETLPRIVSRLMVFDPIRHLERLRRIAREQPAYWNEQPKLSFDGLWVSALWYGRLQVAMWVDHQPDLRCEGTAGEMWGRILSAPNPFHAIAYLMETRGRPFTRAPDEYDVRRVVKRGLVHILRAFDEFGVQVRYSIETTAIASTCPVRRGGLEMVRFLHERTPHLWTTDAMDAAARSGHLEVVRFLHEQRTEGCTANAVTGAAEGGHLDVVRFLLRHRTEGSAAHVMERAALAGCYKVVRYIRDTHAGICFTSVGLKAASKHRWFDLLWSTLARNEPLSESDKLRAAVACGDFELTQQLVKLSSRVTPSASTEAARHGHTRIVQFLLERVAQCRHERVLVAAASGGHLETVRFLHENYHEHCTPRSLDKAVRHGCFDVLKYLFTHCCIPRTSLLRPAMHSRKMKVVRLVLDNCSDQDLAEALALATPYQHRLLMDAIERVRLTNCRLSGTE